MIIWLITVMLMQTVPIQRVPSIAHVIQDTLEMALRALVMRRDIFLFLHFECALVKCFFFFLFFFLIVVAQILMSAIHLDYRLIINTWPTSVIKMPTVQTRKDLTTVAAKRVIMEADESAQVLQYIFASR